jgi:hypothetical protein
MVRDLTFDRDALLAPALSPQHARWVMERTAGPMMRVVQTLSQGDPARLEGYRREFDALVAEYIEQNTIRQSYLLSRAIKT